MSSIIEESNEEIRGKVGKMKIPEIRRDERGISTLYVDGRPFFIYGGELHNSDVSDPAYMEREVWPALEGLHMNTVVAPIYWELIEEEPGTYDFRHVDRLILQAREHQMHLMLSRLQEDRKSTRLNSSHANISYAVFCLKK